MAVSRAILALVVFLSAFLLFLAEPMTAKRLLPALGGSAAVWITCLVFYQCALLIGYLYAHIVSRRLSARSQAVAHTILLVLAVAALTGTVRPDRAAGSWHPLQTTLWLLATIIGLPFVALAATTPLVQSWYAQAGEKAGWRIYALSNLGSMLALVVYPWLVEPNLPLGAQRTAWDVGFAAFSVACAGLAWATAASAGFWKSVQPISDRSAEIPVDPLPVDPRTNDGIPAVRKMRPMGTGGGRNPFFAFLRESIRDRNTTPLPPTLFRIPLWVAFPAVSSMLLCAITGHLSQNIAAIPLLWVAPLAAYLLSFIVTFAGPRWYLRPVALLLLAFAIATVGYLLAKQLTVPLAISIPTYVGALFVFCYCCHGELYRLRPAGEHATKFYLLSASVLRRERS